MSSESVVLTVEGGVARLTLNRPAMGNALDLAMARELLHAAIRCDEDAAIRAVLLTGAGRMFCAGGDLRSFAEAGEAIGAALKEEALLLHGALSRLCRMGAPLVVAVNGPAAGAGLPLAACGDVVLAARQSASFVAAYTAAGLLPDGGSTFLLPRLVGLRRAQELLLTNRRLDADEAAAWGLVTRVVDDAALEAEALAVARRFAEGPTGAFGRAKALLLQGGASGFETQMELEAQAIAASARSPDGQEGIQAFLAKRKPAFTGCR